MRTAGGRPGPPEPPDGCSAVTISTHAETKRRQRNGGFSFELGLSEPTCCSRCGFESFRPVTRCPARRRRRSDGNQTLPDRRAGFRASGCAAFDSQRGGGAWRVRADGIGATAVTQRDVAPPVALNQVGLSDAGSEGAKRRAAGVSHCASGREMVRGEPSHRC